MEIMETAITMAKKAASMVKNHNKIYTVMAFWAIWLFGVVGHFAGTHMATLTFFIGFVVSLLAGAYITDNPNSKERKTLEKWVELLSD